MERVVVFGSGGHAKVILDALERQGRYEIAGVLTPSLPRGTSFAGHQVLGDDAALLELAAGTGVVAIGDNWSRAQLVDRVNALCADLRWATVVHPSAQVARGVEIREGSVVLAGAVLNAGARVGRHAIVNTGASLDHESALGDFASLGPGAIVGGEVRIGDYSAIALGANVLHRRVVGVHTVVGAGATVVDNVPDSVVAYGTPARVIRARSVGEPYLAF